MFDNIEQSVVDTGTVVSLKTKNFKNVMLLGFRDVEDVNKWMVRNKEEVILEMFIDSNGEFWKYCILVQRRNV